MSYIGRFAAGSGADPIETLTGNSGGPVPPTGFNINILGTGVITVVGNPGTSTLTITPSGAIASSFPTDSGTATPAAGVLNVFGGTAARDINTSGSGNTIHVDLNNAITLGDLVNITGSAALTLTTGDATITAGNLNLANTTVAGTIGEIKVGGTRYFNNFGTGGSNLFWGANSGNVNVANTGAANVGYGGGTFQSITTGQSNTGMGNASLQNQTTGSQNSAYGASSGTALNTGGNNTLIGFQSGLLLQSGNSSVALGYQAGATWGATVSNNIAIGNVGSVADSGRIRIGTNGTQTTTFIAGIDGVNVGSVAKVVTMASDQLGTATITAGAGITVTPGANTITIASIGSGLTWSVITADQTAAVENGYFANKAGTLALALPATSAVGDVIEVTNENTALGVQFTQAAGQQILIGNTNTTLGAAGTLTSSAVGDTLKIVCKVANTIWRVTSIVGNWTPA